MTPLGIFILASLALIFIVGQIIIQVNKNLHKNYKPIRNGTIRRNLQ